MYRTCRRASLRLLILLAGTVPWACAQGPAHWSEATRARMERPAACVTVFFADGLDTVEVDRLVAAGKLPNIAKHFVAGGVRVRSAVAALPPITYPNSVAMITGLSPGHHGILGNLWFDRRSSLFRDYGFASRYRESNDDFSALTLFELLPDELTASVQAHTRRGADIIIDNWAKTGVDWFLDNYSDVDARVGTCFPRVAERARRAGRWPVVYWNYFPSPDAYAHPASSESQEYDDALAVVDDAIGRIIADVEAADIADRRYYILVSDHGHRPLDPTCQVDLRSWLEERGGRRVRVTPCQSGGEIGRRRVLAAYDTVLTTEASRRAVVHLRGEGGWEEPAPQAVIDRLAGWPPGAAEGLAQLPQVLVVCTRAGADAVRVWGKDGAVRVERREAAGRWEYRMVAIEAVTAGDVLGYRHDPALAAFIDAGWHDSQAWLAATAHEDVRDFVPQIVDMFDSPRAGDIVAFAADNCALELDWQGGHGSCLARDMQVPLFFAGGDLPRGAEIPVGRIVDVMPTTLDLIGRADRLERAGRIDGISLLPQLRAAVPAR